MLKDLYGLEVKWEITMKTIDSILSGQQQFIVDVPPGELTHTYNPTSVNLQGDCIDLDVVNALIREIHPEVQQGWYPRVSGGKAWNSLALGEHLQPAREQ